MSNRSSRRKSQIFAAATRLFLTKGYHATSIADLAAEIGIWKGSPYYYIPSKDDLLSQVILDAVGASESDLVCGGDIPDDARDLKLRIAAHFRYLRRNQMGLGFLLREVDQLPRAKRALIQSRVQQYETILVQFLSAAQNLGVVRDGDPASLAQVVLASATWHPWGRRDAKREALLQKGTLHFLFARHRPIRSEEAFCSSESAVLVASSDVFHFGSSAIPS